MTNGVTGRVLRRCPLVVHGVAKITAVDSSGGSSGETAGATGGHHLLGGSRRLLRASDVLPAEVDAVVMVYNNMSDDCNVTTATVHVQQTADRGHDLVQTLCAVDVYGTPERPKDIVKWQDGRRVYEGNSKSIDIL